MTPITRALVIAAAAAAAAACSQPVRAVSCGGRTGPDVVAGDVIDAVRWGTTGDITAYSFGNAVCNFGTQQLSFVPTAPAHPVFTYNLYRLRNGRFEQVGMSWVRHEFFALATNFCCTCTDGSAGDHLGAGCSSNTSGNAAGIQSLLSKRSEVTPQTGQFLYPFTGPPTTTIGGRLQAHNADVDPALNAGAQYFAEMQYLAPDDAAAGNGVNNASYRAASVGGASGVFNVLLTGSTVRGLPAIEAWAAADPTVVLAHFDVPGDGRLTLASKATDNGDGTWTYEYALHNLNSGRAAGAFSIPLQAGAPTSGVGFHDVDYHSGEVYDGADWTAAMGGGALTWSTVPFATNPNANALRWGTLYNFRLTTNAPPNTASATVTLFTPGSPGTVAVDAIVPSVAACVGDLDGDGSVGAADLAFLLGSWGPVASSADLDGNGVVNAADLALLLGSWGACP